MITAGIGNIITFGIVAPLHYTTDVCYVAYIVATCRMAVGDVMGE